MSHFVMLIDKDIESNKIIDKTQKYNPDPHDDLSPYDIKSIMHYDGTASGVFKNAIMTDKITGKSIESNRQMSPMDIQKLNKMYPCRSIPSCGKFSAASFHCYLFNN